MKIYGSDVEIVASALLERCRKLESAIERKGERERADGVAASIMRRFLVEKHPELTREFCEFITDEKEEHDDCYGSIWAAKGSICALEYHRDTFDDAMVDKTIEQLEKNSI